MSDVLIELEIKIAHLEKANQEMSDVYYQQQQQITALEQQVRLLKAQMQQVKDSDIPEILDERPPHY